MPRILALVNFLTVCRTNVVVSSTEPSSLPLDTTKLLHFCIVNRNVRKFYHQPIISKDSITRVILFYYQSNRYNVA